MPDPAQPVKVDKIAGSITMQNVGFRYGSRAVIKGLDLEIRAGEMIGLVGTAARAKARWSTSSTVSMT